MGFRFRRSMKIAPGVRLNFGKAGVSLSAGVRGASVTAGKRGVYGNVGLPGSGMSYRTRLDGGGSSRSGGRSSDPSPSIAMNVRLALQDDGSVQITGPSGEELPRAAMRVLREQHSDAVERWLEEQADRLNGDVDALLAIHRETPDPAAASEWSPQPFTIPQPVAPDPQDASWFASFIPGRRARVEAENEAAEEKHRENLRTWRQAKELHERRQAVQREIFHGARMGAVEAMEQMLALVLEDIEWPRETLISFDITDESTLFLDVDLPEVEDLPAKRASVAARGWKLNVRERSETEQRRNYRDHIHGIAFRIVGVAFHALPAVTEIVISGYSQRPDSATGQVNDDYLLSARVPRDRWEGIDFTNLELLDPVAAIDRFDLRRNMTKTGIFRPVEPFAPAD